jgi:hypothetical protein
MAKYTFSLDSYDIKDTRSRHEDTNYVSVALSVNGKIIGNPQTKFMGDQNNGTFHVGLNFAEVEVPENATVIMMYQILNSGHANQADLEKALTDALWEAPSGDAWWETFKKYLLKYGLPLVFPNCDGPITPEAGRQIVWKSAELKGIAPGEKFEDTQNEPGNKSPAGCGSNSHYIVHYTVTAAA